MMGFTDIYIDIVMSDWMYGNLCMEKLRWEIAGWRCRLGWVGNLSVLDGW